MVQHTPTSVVTIERFIIEQERLHPEATGELSERSSQELVSISLVS